MKIKKIFSCSVIASALLSGMMSADAAVINKYPYFQDYENVGDITLTDSLFDESTNPLDCVFYAQGDELTLGEDEDFPERGKVLKHITKGSAEKFILWKFPNRTEGIVAISFDMRHNDDRMIYMKFSNKVWEPIIRLDDNKYEFIGSSETGTYSKDEWYKVKIAVNLDEHTKTISFNGKEYTTDFGEAALSEFYIQMQADTTPESEFTEIFVDNMKIETMDAVADVKLYSSDEEIKGITGVTDKLYLKVSDNESDMLSSYYAEDITLTDLGDDRISVTEETVEFGALASDNKLELNLKSDLKDGHRYRLTIPEDAKTVFARPLSVTEFEFLVSQDGGMVMVEKGEDFSGISELSTVSRGEPVSEGSLLKYYSAKSSTKTYTLFEDETLRGGKGLTLKGDRALGLDIENGTGLLLGEYEFEVRYKVNSGCAKISLANSGITNGIPLLETTGTGNTLYKQYENVSSGLEKQYLSANDGWNVAKFRINIDEKVLKYDVEGQTGTVDLPYYDSSTKQNLLTGGIGFIRFEQSEKGTSGEVLLDYIMVGSKKEVANVSKVTFTDSDNNTDVYIKDSYLAPDTEYVQIYFNGNIKSESLKDIKLLCDGENEDISVSYDTASGVCTITLNNYLKANSDYELIIPKEVTGQEIKGNIKTGDGVYRVKTLEFTDSEGETATNPVFAKNLKLCIINTSEQSEKMSLAYSSHSGYYLKNMMFKNIEVMPDMRKAEFIVPISKDEEADNLQGFLVSDIISVTPKESYVKIGR